MTHKLLLKTDHSSTEGSFYTCSPHQQQKSQHCSRQTVRLKITFSLSDGVQTAKSCICHLFSFAVFCLSLLSTTSPTVCAQFAALKPNICALEINTVRSFKSPSSCPCLLYLSVCPQNRGHLASGRC